MIKQIQLRGISRTPSDRMSADGGCAESLNVHIEEQELSPTLAPEDATTELGLPANAMKGYIYIHKGNGYTNYITLDGMEIGAYIFDEQSRGYIHEAFAYMEQGEVLQSVSSIGNTIIIMGDRHPYYAIYKDGHYTFLGNMIPLPTIRVTPEPVDEEIVEHKSFLDGGGMSPEPGELGHITPASEFYTKDTWNEEARSAEENGKRFAGVKDIPDAEPGEDEQPDYMTYMKEFATQAYATAKSRNVLINQVMVVYGIQLYNGSYITSVPYLMPGGFESPFFCRYLRYAKVHSGSLNENTEYIQYGARYPYKIKAQMLDFDEQTLKLWSDIIMSVDFFMTPTIPFDVSKEKVMYVTQELKTSVSATSGSNTTHFNYMELRPCSTKYSRDYIKRVLNNGSDMFRKVESINTDGSSFEAIDRLVQLREGTLLDINDFIADQDLLLTQPALADYSYDMANAERTGKDVSNINNRLLMTGVVETIPAGSQVFPAAPCWLEEKENVSLFPYIDESYITNAYTLGSVDSQLRLAIGLGNSPIGKMKSSFAFPQPVKYVQLVYHIQGKERYVVRGRIGQQGSFVESTGRELGYFGFLIFPDTRCKSVDIYLSYDNATWYVKSYGMREHPRLNCSYLYAGVDKNLFWDIAPVTQIYQQGLPHYFDMRTDGIVGYVTNIVENRVESKDNALLLSDVDNPWFFPLENQYQMQATEIIGTALATKALSTGQFGQFPLYVFTDNGIWAMQMTETGTFASAHAVSMDVAKRGTILALDQAVVFLTDKGVLLLTGSDIKNLSPYMNGKHYTVERDAASLIRRSDWSNLLESITDNTHFMAFMEGATPAYDYTGERIIFFHPSKPYMYVYMLKTATWHKATMPEGSQVERLLNSYPDTYVAVKTLGYGGNVHYAKILDFSTPLDVTSRDDRKAVVVTRPFDLGEPDIRKTLKSIRIRGEYNRRDVQYILLGSMDGINWGVLPSLRGGSYKLYRLILLCNLSPTERISWVDVDYESRLANKLR